MGYIHKPRINLLLDLGDDREPLRLLAGKTAMPGAGNDVKIGDQALSWGWEGKTGRIADYRHLSL